MSLPAGLGKPYLTHIPIQHGLGRMPHAPSRDASPKV